MLGHKCPLCQEQVFTEKNMETHLITHSTHEQEGHHIGYKRYELVRCLSPREFTALWTMNVAGQGAFDDLVDKMIEERKQKK